jgi:hypothetical protein
MDQYNNAMNILGCAGIYEIRAKLDTPHEAEVLQALCDYVNAYLETLQPDRVDRDTIETTWFVLMRLVGGYNGIPLEN